MIPEADADLSPLERFRSYLLLLARLQLGGRAPGRFDASDLVQQTLLEAHRDQQHYRGATDAERAAWLRRALARNFADADRAQRRGRRDVRRERSLEAALEQSSALLAGGPVADQSSPSQQAVRHEEAVRLASALERLPEAQREALVLQHWHGLTLAEIGERLPRGGSRPAQARAEAAARVAGGTRLSAGRAQFRRGRRLEG